MTKRGKEAPIVAELGRPETPEETQARLAENSRLYRQRKTINNLFAAIGVTLLAVAVLVLVVPRDDREVLPDIDYQTVAQEAQYGITDTLAVPLIPDNWVSNEAEIRTTGDGVTEWYVGFLVVEDEKAREYVGLSQGFNANETWVYEKLQRRPATGSVIVDGVEWTEYDYTALPSEEAGNYAYSLVRETAEGTLVLYGSHSAEAVHQLARGIDL